MRLYPPGFAFRMCRAVSWVCALAAVASHAAIELRVAPNGRTNGTGTAADPLPSLEAARDALRAHSPAQRQGATVLLADGVYRVRETIRFTGNDSGTPEHPVVYRAVPGARPILVGSLPVPRTALQPVTDPALLARIHPEAREAVRQVALGPLRCPTIQPFARTFLEGWRVLEVHCDGQILPQSRWPNSGYTTMARVLDSGDFQARGKRGGRFVYRDDRPANWTRALKDGGVWLRGFWRVPWVIEGVQVASIDATNRVITLAAPVARGIGSKYTREVNGTRAGDGKESWHAINLIEEIDTPGEWAIDFRRQLLVIWPPATRDAAAPLELCIDREPVIALTETSHVRLQGLTVEGRLGDGITVRGGDGVLIAGCTVRRLGGTGILVRGGSRHRLVSNDIHDTGRSGIDLTGGDRRTLTPSAHEVLNNHVHHVSRDFPVAAVIVGYQPANGRNDRAEVVGVRVANNRIHDASNAGVYYGGAENTFEYNDVYRVGLDSGDLGGFYSTGGWTTFGNVLRHNFVHDSPNANAFYLDDGDSGDLVISNVVYRTSTGGFVGGGHFNEIRANFFIECSRAGAHVDARGASRGYTLTDPRLRTDLDSVHPSESPWKERFPQIAEITANDPTLPRGVVIAGNMFVDCAEPVRLGGKPSELQGVTVKDNLLTGSLADFVDPATLNFALRPGAAAFQSLPGIESVPMDRIGLQIDEYRREVPPRGSAAGTTADPKAAGFDSVRDIEASNREKK